MPPAEWVADPLSAPNWFSRLWAARVKKGWGLVEGAEYMGFGKRYQTLKEWEKGQPQKPSLGRLGFAASAVGYTLDQIFYGYTGSAAHTRLPPELDVREQRILLTEENASGKQRSAWGVHVDSSTGKFQRVTPTYLKAFIKTYAMEIASGAAETEAINRAAHDAIEARAVEDAAVFERADPRTTGERKIG